MVSNIICSLLNAEYVVAESIRDIGTLTEDEARFFREFIKTSEVQKMCHPLYGALLYSPLYLLSHRKLTNNAWDQDKMLKVQYHIFNM